MPRTQTRTRSNPRSSLPRTVAFKAGTETLTLHREQFTAREWNTVAGRAVLHAAFTKGAPVEVEGSECFTCHKPQMILVDERQVGPECVVVRYRCMACGEEDTDAID